ncbi:hypothetical protein EYF88_06095 [Paracoccus sediminis]|uniref:Uncharacterized protein n=1 Tax=Paracoccus sediminis TaxID=1214787 RepID=A0A238VWP2_9RHOB|nr:hypothetical protein [Paracoccus sediminis]TBN51370.1 hypothetical protein EYF88_06095 [Paracoccus sediminis]SNR38720.1 hypothetical protein SAMN06265378_103127 [Paracoccus sediminis]
MDTAHSDRRRWRARRWGAIGALLLAPVLGMAVSDQVAWGPADFLLAGLLLAGGNLLYEGLSRRRPTLQRRLIAGAIGLAVLVLWAQGAVGIL